MFPLDATNASFIMGFIVFVSSRLDTASQYGMGRNISISRKKKKKKKFSLTLEAFGQSQRTR